jgi:hypothetical protein
VGDNLDGVYAGIDDLEGDPLAQGLLVVGHPDGAHADRANLLEELVWGERTAGTFSAAGLINDGGRAGGIGRRREIC